MKSWPLFDLRIQTPDLELRLPTDTEIDGLARRSHGRILAPDQLFLSDWAFLPSPAYERGMIAWHWRSRAEWTPESWRLQLAAFPRDEPEAVGAIDVHATLFGVRAEVVTGSWLIDSVRGRGWGRQMRAGMLHLAFDHLGAEIARSSANVSNGPSLGVSRSLGYRDDGTKRSSFQSRAVDLQRVRLDAVDWVCPPGYSVTGLDGCRDMFG